MERRYVFQLLGTYADENIVPGTWLLFFATVVSRVGCSKPGTPALTERLVPQGSWFKARAGRLRINIQDSSHTFGE